jgi:acetyl-CoA synthetase
MAELTEISEALYCSYETGKIDLPFTFIHKCAKAYGIEITDLLEGHSAKLSGYTVTRRGEGLTTAEEDGITIQALASQFRRKAVMIMSVVANIFKPDQKELTKEEREKELHNMITLALETAIAE